jgi:hypothetical protein
MTLGKCFKGGQVTDGWNRAMAHMRFSGHRACLLAQENPVVNGTATHTKGLVCPHLAHALIYGFQYPQPQVVTVRCSHALQCSVLPLIRYK